MWIRKVTNCFYLNLINYTEIWHFTCNFKFKVPTHSLMMIKMMMKWIIWRNGKADVLNWWSYTFNYIPFAINDLLWLSEVPLASCTVYISYYHNLESTWCTTKSSYILRQRTLQRNLKRFSGHEQLLVLILQMFKIVCSCPKHLDLKYCKKCALPPLITFLEQLASQPFFLQKSSIWVNNERGK